MLMNQLIKDFGEEFKNIANLINANAPVKIICKNKNDNEIIHTTEIMI